MEAKFIEPLTPDTAPLLEPSLDLHGCAGNPNPMIAAIARGGGTGARRRT
jgi:hypothetical protein